MLLVVDSSMLGGMADEDLGGPASKRWWCRVQAKTIRETTTTSGSCHAALTVPVVSSRLPVARSRAPDGYYV